MFSRVCGCLCVCVRVYALIILSPDKILRCITTLIIMIIIITVLKKQFRETIPSELHGGKVGVGNLVLSDISLPLCHYPMHTSMN